MLNGKFYTGLTANQMSRKSDGVDRQKSSFFWPDETDTIPKAYRKPANSKSSTPQQPSPAATPDREIHPKELFQKQLTSKIEFCDDFYKSPLPSRRNNAAYRATPKDSPAKQMNHSKSSRANESFTKPNTFESKIEFYDYDELPATVVASTPVKRYEEDTRTKSDSPTKNANTDRKKITFDDRVKKSILKNNEIRPSMHVEHNIAIDRLPQFKKNIVPKRNLSKSVENISKLEINSDHSPVRNNNTTPTTTVNEIVKTVANINEPQSRIEYRQEQQEHYSTSSNSHRNYEEPSKVVQKSRKSVRNDYAYRDNHGSNNSYTHEEVYDDWSDGHNHHSRNVSNHQNQSPNNRSTENRRYSNQTDVVHQDHRGISSSGNHSTHHIDTSSPRNTGRRNTSRLDYDDDCSRDEFRSTSNRRHQATRHYENPMGLVIPQYPNEASNRAHSHLRSNIFFNDNSYAEDQPRSVRESAVARVGVGLPNI